VIDMLLTGDFLNVHESRARGIDDWYQGWAPILDYGESELRAAWREHRAWLLAEWQRRGGSGPSWAARVFGEEGA